MNPITKAYMINNGQYTYSWFMYDLSTSLTYMLFLQVDYFFVNMSTENYVRRLRMFFVNDPKPPIEGFDQDGHEWELRPEVNVGQ